MTLLSTNKAEKQNVLSLENNLYIMFIIQLELLEASTLKY